MSERSEQELLNGSKKLKINEQGKSDQISNTNLERIDVVSGNNPNVNSPDGGENKGETIPIPQSPQMNENAKLEEDKNEDEKKEEANQEQPKTCAKKVGEVLLFYLKRYFIDGFTGTTHGLFCTLIGGTILAQIADWCGNNSFGHTLNYFASIAKMEMGAGIGVGIAYKFQNKPLIIFSAAVTGKIGAFSKDLVNMLIHDKSFNIGFGAPGNPIGSLIMVYFTSEIARLYVGKTRLDIVFVPLGMILLCFIGIFIAWPFIEIFDLLGEGIGKAVESGDAVKILVGILVSVILGILLTLPTSSAATWIAIATSEKALKKKNSFDIAGGAAVAGCASHMIGFAVSSFRENSWSGLIAQGLGTSMLQSPNVLKKPIIMVPEIITSVIAGIIAVVMDLRCNASGGGMGTSGLVGVMGTIDASEDAIPKWKLGLGIAICLFIIPAGFSLLFTEIFRKCGLIKPEDMKLPES